MEGIFEWLKQNNYQIWAHARSEGDLRIVPADDFKFVDFSSEIPIESWKQAVFPSKHTLFEFDNSPSSPSYFKRGLGGVKIALFGIRIFDLEALQLYDAVFADDPYYQERRKNIIIVGFAPYNREAAIRGFAPKNEKNDSEILFDKTFSEEKLSSCNFDIFFDEKNKKYYCGSKLGEKILKKLKIKFNNSPSSPSYFKRGLGGVTAFERSEVWKNYLQWKKVVENTLDSKVWDELGKICLACGKCSIACPTCFCFDIADEFSASSTRGARSTIVETTRNRCWGNCFYQEFHRVAQNNFLVDNIRDRIAFWYTHKFVRIPNDYKLRGCVGCRRCFKVCPVEINIEQNLKNLKKDLK